MGMISFGRTGSGVPWLTHVRPSLERSGRQLAALRIAGAERKLVHVGRDVDDDPVPETAPGRRVRVVAGHGKALHVSGRAIPPQVRGNIAARAAEAVLGRQDVVLA